MTLDDFTNPDHTFDEGKVALVLKKNPETSGSIVLPFPPTSQSWQSVRASEQGQ